MITQYCGECVVEAYGSRGDGLGGIVRLCPLHAVAYDAVFLLHEIAGSLTRLPLDSVEVKSRAQDIVARLGKETLARISQRGLARIVPDEDIPKGPGGCWPYPENQRLCGKHAATIEPYCTRQRMDDEHQIKTLEDEIGALMNAIYGGHEETP